MDYMLAERNLALPPDRMEWVLSIVLKRTAPDIYLNQRRSVLFLLLQGAAWNTLASRQFPTGSE
jgi:hypothetical protein